MTKKNTTLSATTTIKSYKRLENLLNYKKNRWVSRNFALSLKKRLFSGPNWNSNGGQNTTLVSNTTPISTSDKAVGINENGTISRGRIPRDDVPSDTTDKTLINDIVWENWEKKGINDYKYILRKEKLDLYDYENEPSMSATASPTDLSTIRLKKRKYSLNSYLYNTICKFPRKYTYHFLGKEKFRRYYTMPLRLSMSRFLSNRLLKSYYKNLSAKALEKMCQGKKKPIGTSPLMDTFSKGLYVPTHGIGARQNWNKNEKAKNFLLLLEQRLDTSLLRLLNHKPIYVRKRMTPKQRWQQNRAGHQDKYPKPRSYRLTSPISKYTPLQIKQLINHGHIYVNGKKETTPSRLIRYTDKIKIAGATSTGLPQGTEEILAKSLLISHPDALSAPLIKSHNNTILLRRLKDQSYLSLDNNQDMPTDADTPVVEIPNDGEPTTEAETLSAPHSPHISEQTAGLVDHIKNLKIKRFIEIYYMTYRNLHLIERPIPIVPSSDIQSTQTSLEVGTSSDVSGNAGETLDSGPHPVENHIKPIFDRIGYNQSIFLLWPVTGMLKISSWGPAIKNHFTTLLKKRPAQKKAFQGIRDDASVKRELQSFLRWKRLQNSGGWDNKLSSTGSQNMDETPTRIKGLQPSEKRSIPDEVIRILDNNSSFIYAESSRCYASMVYGTRKCKWVRLQQTAPRVYYHDIYQRTNFLETELDFFQLTLEYYKN